jgi:hypothetical protein
LRAPSILCSAFDNSTEEQAVARLLGAKGAQWGIWRHKSVELLARGARRCSAPAPPSPWVPGRHPQQRLLARRSRIRGAPRTHSNSPLSCRGALPIKLRPPENRTASTGFRPAVRIACPSIADCSTSVWMRRQRRARRSAARGRPWKPAPADRPLSRQFRRRLRRQTSTGCWSRVRRRHRPTRRGSRMAP